MSATSFEPDSVMEFDLNRLLLHSASGKLFHTLCVGVLGVAGLFSSMGRTDRTVPYWGSTESKTPVSSWRRRILTSSRSRL